MEQAQTSSCRFRRLLVVAGAACVLAAVGAPTAAAELGLPALTEAGLPVPAIAAVPEVLEAPEQTIEAAPNESLAQATETLAQAAAPTLSRTIEILAQTTAPLLESVQQTQLLPATAETLAEVTGSVVTPAVDALPVLGAAAEPLEETLPNLDPVLETTTQPLIAADASLAETAPPAAPPAPASSDREMLTTPTRRAPGEPLEDSSSIVLPALPSVPAGPGDTTAGLGRTTASPMPPSVPGPFAPGGSLSDLASAFASAGASALVLLLAALAATLLLAVPGLGRRLRPRLAPWPQSIPQLSLERPG